MDHVHPTDGSVPDPAVISMLSITLSSKQPHKPAPERHAFLARTPVYHITTIRCSCPD